MAQDLRAVILAAEAGENSAWPAPIGRLLGSSPAHTTALRWLAYWHLSRGDLARARDAIGRLERVSPRSLIGEALTRAAGLAAGVPPQRLEALTRTVLEGPYQGIETRLLIEILKARGEVDVARSLSTTLDRPAARPATAPAAASIRRRSSISAIVDVIVPVYRGKVETLACLASALDQPCRQKMRVVVVDDRSPEPDLSEALRALARAGRIDLLANDENLGFVRSVNKAMALHPKRDAVILNADTLVGPGWLDRLLGAARGDAAIGTATPLSNNATICSYPYPDRRNPLPSPAEMAAIDRACSAAGPGGVVDLPTGVGFCMFIRRACWKEVGGFDAERFGRGYGEENDFCLRARKHGWRNVAATDVYVAHRGNVSFGADASPGISRALQVLNATYPGYDRMIADWIAADPMREARRRIDLERLAGSSETRRFMMITSNVIGGTERHVRHLADRLAGEGIGTVVLKPAAGNGDIGRIALEGLGHGAFPNLVYDAEGEWQLLLDDLGRLRISHVHLHHLLRLPEKVLDLAPALGCPFDVTVHDYSWICKRINLIDETGRYCGEPTAAVCDTCVQINGADFEEPASTAELRRRSAKVFALARAVFVPSEDAGRRMARHFPKATFALRQHEEPAAGEVKVAVPPKDGPLRVAVIGAIGPHKGYDVLLACARDAARRELPIEFRVIGYTSDDLPLIRSGRAWVTGRFAENELGELIEAERCHAAFLPSVWPETWCYALGSALRAGLTPFVFDIGAMPDRLKQAGIGVCLPLEIGPAAINDRLLAFRASKPPRSVIDLTGAPLSRILDEYYALPSVTEAARRKGRKADRSILESAR